MTFTDLPAPYDTFNGSSMWVGDPRRVSEIGGLGDNTPPTIQVAPLQCDPYYTDWSILDTVHVYGALIIPDGSYTIQAVTTGCSAATESNYSSGLTVSTARHGDIAGAFESNWWSEPDGGVDITTDVISAIDKFRSTPTAPSKPRADVEPAIPDQLINITDAVVIIDAFRGLPYPFPPPANPCP